MSFRFTTAGESHGPGLVTIVEGLPAGEFDRKMEEAGAESNASTWLDWTQYNEAIPKTQLGLVVKLEADRMARLVLRRETLDTMVERSALPPSAADRPAPGR